MTTLRRVWIAPLAAMAAALASCGSGAGKSTGAGSGDPQAKSAAEAFCQKGLECGGFAASMFDQCVAATAQTFFSVLPDPGATIACLNASTCESLMNSMQATVLACVDLDTTATHCSGATSLHICTNRGVCKDDDCIALCATYAAGSTPGCAFNAQAGYDKCTCTL